MSRQNLLILIGVGIVVAIPTLLAIVRTAREPGERIRSQGNLHIDSVDVAHPPYNSDPPTSGWHIGSLGRRGNFIEPVADEILIHNLEDGDVILWYRAGTPEENEREAERLETVLAGVRGNREQTIIMPREGLDSRYVLTAWQRLQRFDDIDEEGMRTFIEAYIGLDHHARF